MPVDALNLAIVDELAFFRKGVKEYLSEQISINVIFQASDLSDVLYHLEHAKVDILLVDVFSSRSGNSDVLKMIHEKHPTIKILILSSCTDPQLISNLMDYDIHGYISKMDEPEELLHAIMAVSKNKIYPNKLFTEALYWNRQKNIIYDQGKSDVLLNEREQKILKFIWEEKSNKEIADSFFLSIRSIEKIRQDMKEKLGVKSTVGLLKYGIVQKIIDTNTII
ncbi:response regulator transcription factor [Chitinophaga silvisoli]|uniref:DNA-binding response regulator n=1 Tax=Chitinophaga silvisoli TaxID=2291814 RepID=A0A3E1P070_9BACT|nr:response regulator transcription factor [Chitinophaga silvisoli]RFM33514.1 DNA-binding response regulator [Chitinophaga silvisoli]